MSGAPGQRVLIVVEEPDLATTCARFLRQMGYVPRTAPSGEDALPLIDDDWPDLVLADVRLPGMVDGLGILQHVRRAARRSPVILCAARASDLSRREALDAGAGGYVVKPFTLVELRTAVERALARAVAPDVSGGAL